MRNNETGRSMVEMLGVLAVIGVLSIGGIAGYMMAMNRHHSNSIVAGVSARAITVSAEKMMGRSAMHPADMETNIDGYPVTVGEADDVGQDYFEVVVSGVPQGPCRYVLNQNWATPEGIYLNNAVDSAEDGSDCREENNTIAFVFSPSMGGESHTCGYCQHDENGTCVADETCDNGCSGDKPILQANGTCGSCPTIVAPYFGGANEQECQKCGSYYHAWNGACKSDPENCPEGSFQFRDTCYDCHYPDDLHSITAEELERCASACRGIRIITTAPGWGTSCALPCNGKGQFYDGWGYCRTCGVTQYWGNCTGKCPGLTYAAGNYSDDCQIVSNCPEGQHLDACCASGYVYHETKKSYYGQYSMGVCCPSTRPNWDGSKCTE